MQVYLVRHTETVCEKGICYGQSDVGLQTDFLTQFSSIKEQLPENAIVFSSPLVRCTHLAEFCYPLKNVSLDKRLMEMDFGNWELQAWDTIPENELNPWMAEFVTVKVPNGESFEILYERVIQFWQEILEKSIDLPIVVFTHAGVIRSLLCLFNDQPLQDAFLNKVEFGEVKYFQFQY